MNKKIFIVFLGDYRFDARCINMLNTLLLKKNKVSILHYKDAKHSAVGLSSPLLTEVSVDPGNTRFIKYLFWWFLIYKNLCSQAKNTTVIASDLYSLVPVCFLNKLNKIIYDSREIYTALDIHYKHPIKNLIIKYIERFCVARVSTIITTAPSDEKYLRKIYTAFHKIKFEVIYNYPRKILKTKPNYIREKFKLSNNKIILIYQGMLQPGRGILQLFQIVKNMKNFVGIIVGSGEKEDYYKSFVKAQKLNHKIYFISKTPYLNLLEITSSADIGIALIKPLSISYRYALPNKLFEYAAAGIPSLASNLPNMQYYIKKYNLGKTVCPDQLGAQILAINKLRSFDKHSFVGVQDLLWEKQEDRFYNLVVYS